MKRFVVLAAIDFSDASDAVALEALALAGSHGRSEVHFATVQETAIELLAPPADQVRSPVAPLLALAETAMHRFEESHAIPLIGRVLVHTLLGDPAREIVALAAHLDADLVVLGTHGRRGLARVVLGSVAEKVVRTAGCAVFVARRKAHAEALKAPEVEALCADCAEARKVSSGGVVWCARHGQLQAHAHVYAYDERADRELQASGSPP